MRITGVFLLAVVLLTACGSDNDNSQTGDKPAAVASTSSVPTEPATTDLSVTITDSVPLSLLYNVKDGYCTSQSTVEMIDRVMAGENDPEPTPVVITLMDAAGTVVAQQTLELVGGAWAHKSCEWSITFEDVPAGDFYSARLTGYQFEDETTGPVSGLEFRI